MNLNIRKNFFVLEGVDGAGKTTLINSIKKEFPDIEILKEPTEGYYGKIVNYNISKLGETENDSERKNFNNCIIKATFLDRKEHQTTIKKILQQNKIILIDRYILSTMAYQGFYSSFYDILDINKEFIFPKTIFFLDTPLDIVEERLKQKENTVYFERIEVMREIYNNYLKAIDFIQNKGIDVVFLKDSPEETLKKYFVNFFSTYY